MELVRPERLAALPNESQVVSALVRGAGGGRVWSPGQESRPSDGPLEGMGRVIRPLWGIELPHSRGTAWTRPRGEHSMFESR